ncbi:acyl-CoA dehydrogenase family protein [Ornithinimicrobium murale]|uniref:acyl-CoA dehydrogenase family protein n=1 Tax=Ornithinimicrobium murale TaxID=1050153 RepID=UPI000E0D1D76|nr:acyl-CoA dehydrogenase family protein [Ornithinimicrobium murale]
MPGSRALLTDDLLERIRGRAAQTDRDNGFPEEDLAELTEAGYLRAMVPEELGGLGLTLEEMTREQMRLAGAAPATALSVNMHQVWMGVARLLHTRGEDSMDWALAEAVAGEVFGFGISEAGNDLVLFGSRTEARPDGAGGFGFHGTKIFTSLAPAWTRLGTFGTDSTGAEPMSVFGFITRDGGGFEVRDDWDTLGMRGSQSRTTVLDGAHAPADRVIRRIPPGPTADPFVFGIFANFELLLASVYTGIAQRALDLAVATVHKRTSLKNNGAPYAHDPDIRWRLADAAIELDAIHPQIGALAHDVDNGVERGPIWMPQLSAVKSRATETALSVVTKAVRVSGGSSYFNANELSRLYRDVLAGIFHPSDDESVHGAWANALLGPLPTSG